MQYQKIKPSPILQPFVKWFFILEHDKWLEKPFIIKTSATFSFAMVFNYGTPHHIFNDKHHGEKLPASFISGISVSPYKLSYQGKVSMLGVIFINTSFQELFAVPPLNLWIDQRYDFYNVIGYESITINEKLAAAENTSERITIIENWLERRINKLQPEKKLMDQAVEIILNRKGMLKMDDLAGIMNISPRQLRRSFNSRVGVNPKTYARLKRFSYINQRLSKDEHLPWHFFLNEGFYDQSHMIKEYHEFSRENPSSLLQNMRKLYQQLTFQALPE